jgi:hypothetical protein
MKQALNRCPTGNGAQALWGPWGKSCRAAAASCRPCCPCRSRSRRQYRPGRTWRPCIRRRSCCSLCPGSWCHTRRPIRTWTRPAGAGQRASALCTRTNKLAQVGKAARRTSPHLVGAALARGAVVAGSAIAGRVVAGGALAAVSTREASLANCGRRQMGQAGEMAARMPCHMQPRSELGPHHSECHPTPGCSGSRSQCWGSRCCRRRRSARSQRSRTGTARRCSRPCTRSSWTQCSRPACRLEG